MELYVVGKYVRKTKDGAVWEIQGVYDNKESAEANCADYRFFVGLMNLNEPLPIKKEAWESCYYPNSKKISEE